MSNILLKNGIIVTVDENRNIYYDGAIVIKDNIIEVVGLSKEIEEKYKDVNEVIDLGGKIIFPGFINTHTHLFQTLLKGLGDDMVLKDWLHNMMFPASSHITTEDTYLAAMVGSIDALRSGATTIVDYMHPHPIPNLCDGICEAFKDLKIRGILGRGVLDIGADASIMQNVNTAEKDIRRLFDKYHNSENGRIKVCVAPSSMWACSKDMIKMLWNTTSEYNSGFTVHISESEFSRNASKNVHGVNDIEALEKYGIIGSRVLAVHCIYITDRDMDFIKKNNISVSHNVVANMYLSSGVAPIPAMLKKGITVGLGVDGAASNNGQDMIELMKITALQHKVHNLDPEAMIAEKVLEMATIDGAKACGLENEIGSLEVGKKADLIVFNPYKCAKSIPMHNPVSTLIYSSSSNNIESVMIDGKFVILNDKLTTVNEYDILVAAQKAADNLATRANITNRREGHKWRFLR